MRNNSTYIIGEIGQNHNGSVEIAKLIIDLISRPVIDELFGHSLKPMDAVKLTKRDLNEELSVSQMNKPYSNPNSFGATYGEHRKYLELSDEEHLEIYKHTKLKGLDLIETICAIGALKLLKSFTPDYIKIASRDLTNIPLLCAIGETKIPIILSTGMAGRYELDNAIDTISKSHNKISILHCVSEYPTNPINANLNSIPYLIKHYPDYIVGYSDHTIGISAPIAAVALGAKIIEKHVTIDRRMKGTDQAGSLGPDGVNRMIRDIRLTELSLGEEDIFIADSVNTARQKLERSIATNRDIDTGDTIRVEDLHMLSPGDGYKWADKSKIIGRKAIKPIPRDEIIYESYLEK